jgi:hypothetical protein
LHYINIKVEHKKAELITPIDIICDNNDYVVNFTFDSEWDNHPHKTARFFYNGKYDEVVFEGDTCIAPPIHDAKGVFVGVYSGDMSTTSPVLVPCVPSILTLGDVHADPPKDVYLQMLELLNDLKIESEGLPYEDEPLMDGEANPGESKYYSRGDHVHPTDTSRASAEEFKQLVEVVDQVTHDIAEMDAPSMKTAIQEATETANAAKETADSISHRVDTSLSLAASAFDISADAKAISDESKAISDEAKALVIAETERATEAEKNLSNKISDDVERLETSIEAVGTQAQRSITDERQRAIQAERELATSIVNADYNENDPTKPSYIKNRPFFRGFTKHTPDEETAVDFGGVLFRKCYDTAIAKDKIIGAKYKLNYSIGGNEGSIEHTITANDWQLSAEAGFIKDYSAWILINEEGLLPEDFIPPAVIVVYDYEALNADSGTSFTSNGVYLVQYNGEGMSIEVEWVALEGAQKLDNEFLDLPNNADFKALGKEVETAMHIAKGAQQAEKYDFISDMVEALHNEVANRYKRGNNLYIVDTGVPDFWVVTSAEEYSNYNYIDDASLVADLKANGTIKIGYYVLAQLETDKPDLTNVPTYDDLDGYVKQVDFSKTNTLPIGSAGGVQGHLYGRDFTDNENTFIVSAGQMNAGNIPIRDSYGNFYVSVTQYDYHAANKKYVDSRINEVSANSVKKSDYELLVTADVSLYEGVPYGIPDLYTKLYKASDILPTTEEIIGAVIRGTVKEKISSNSSEVEFEHIVSEADTITTYPWGFTVKFEVALPISSEPTYGLIYVVYDYTQVTTAINFLENGLYLSHYLYQHSDEKRCYLNTATYTVDGIKAKVNMPRLYEHRVLIVKDFQTDNTIGFTAATTIYNRNPNAITDISKLIPYAKSLVLSNYHEDIVNNRGYKNTVGCEITNDSAIGIAYLEDGNRIEKWVYNGEYRLTDTVTEI